MKCDLRRADAGVGVWFAEGLKCGVGVAEQVACEAVFARSECVGWYGPESYAAGVSQDGEGCVYETKV